MLDKKEFEQKFDYFFGKFAKIISEDEGINAALKESKASEKIKNRLIITLTFFTLKQFFEGSDDETYKEIVSFVEKQLDNFRDEKTFPQLQVMASQNFEAWQKAFLDQERKHSDEHDGKDSSSSKDNDEKAQLTKDKAFKILNIIASIFAENIEKQEDFTNLVKSYHSDVKDDILRAIVICFSTHLFQNILAKKTTNDWLSILPENIWLSFFKFSNDSLNDLKDKIAKKIDHIDTLQSIINSLYNIYGSKYEVEVYNKLTKK